MEQKKAKSCRDSAIELARDGCEHAAPHLCSDCRRVLIATMETWPIGVVMTSWTFTIGSWVVTICPNVVRYVYRWWNHRQGLRIHWRPRELWDMDEERVYRGFEWHPFGITGRKLEIERGTDEA